VEPCQDKAGHTCKHATIPEVEPVGTALRGHKELTCSAKSEASRT
jgi:hypothetical protein